MVSEPPNHHLKLFGGSGKASGSFLAATKKFEKIMKNRLRDDFGHFFTFLQNQSWMVSEPPNHRLVSFGV